MSDSFDETTATTLICPECGHTFSRPAALGAHRSRVHGVKGTTRLARDRSRVRAARTRTRTRSQNSSRVEASLNHDRLIGVVFPSGVPPRVEAIQRLNAWLEEAEAISKLK